MSRIPPLERRSATRPDLRLQRPPHMQGWEGMRMRLLLSSVFVGLAALAAPALAAAESFPDKASGYVSDHTGYFVAALLLAILVLLLVVNISRRRSKEKAKAPVPLPPPGVAATAQSPGGAPPAPAAVGAPTAEMASVPPPMPTAVP